METKNTEICTAENTKKEICIAESEAKKIYTADTITEFLKSFNEKLTNSARTLAETISANVFNIIRSSPYEYAGSACIGFFIDVISEDFSSFELGSIQAVGYYGESFYLEDEASEIFFSNDSILSLFCLDSDYDAVYSELPKKQLAPLVSALNDIGFTCFLCEEDSTLFVAFSTT